MPALFKPKTQKILGGDASAPNPMSGYMVGGCEEGKELEEDHVQLQPGDRVCVTGPNEYQGEFAEVVELSPSGKFVTVSLENSGDEAHLHLSDVEYTADESQMDDDDDYDDSDDSEFTEDKKLGEEASDDMLTKVKASFADYLQKLEDNIKQDKDLLAKKKDDFDLKKKKMKDLELQIKQKKAEQEEVNEDAEDVSLRITFTPDDIEVIEDAIKKAKSIPSSGIFEHILDEYYAVAGEHAEDQQIQITLSNDDVDNIQGVINQFGKRLDATGILEHIMNEYQNVAGEDLTEGDPERYEVTYYDKSGRAGSSKTFSDRAKAEKHAAGGNAIDKVGGEYRVHKVGADIDEGDTYAQGGTNTYAECVLPVVKTITFEDGSECTIHGDESNGFIIRRGEKQLPSKFDHLDHATMALDMYRAKKAASQQADQSADYVEEK